MMIVHQRKSGVLAGLDMPLRDALRGVATLADATEDMLEPAARLLPEPLRSRFRGALEALEQAGKRLIHAPIDTRRIAHAAEFLAGRTAPDAGAGATASVIVYAWEHLTETRVAHRHLISETIVADHLARQRAASERRGTGFAAEVLLDLRASSAIGVLPGLARGISGQEEAEVDLALLAIAVWLVSSRAGTLEEEEKLLDLAIALVRALQPEATAALADSDALARFLDATAAHL